jgi:hypothetical protein
MEPELLVGQFRYDVDAQIFLGPLPQFLDPQVGFFGRADTEQARGIVNAALSPPQRNDGRQTTNQGRSPPRPL